MKKVKYFILFIYLLSNIELCCLQCYYLNFHNNHKILQISDEEMLKKENITLNSSINEFNENIIKAKNIKQNIEKEINEIDKLYDKVYKEVTKSFEKKHEKLIKEENDLKEKLQNEVTKIKEKLEIFLSKSNNVIKSSERINKGIKIIENEKEEEKNMIKYLSYVSKINKNIKEINILSNELMKNLKISFNENKNYINYEEYIFNGIKIPKDIEFKDINFNSVKLYWKNDNLNIINIDNKQIKFRVEIRKENSNEKFIQVYEGNNSNCLIDNLNKNTIYEIRICCIYNNIKGCWSKIEKCKTLNYDINRESKILNECEKKNEFLEKIYEWTGFKKLELIYRGTRDGSKSSDFHNKCDNQGPTICLYKNEKGNIFGGFTSISWTNNGEYHSDPKSFIFTLTNIHKTEPTLFPISNNQYSVFHYSSRGPSFGSDCEIYIYENFLNSDSYSNFPCAYMDVLNKGRSIFTGDFNNNNKYFKVKEIEVFKIF